MEIYKIVTDAITEQLQAGVIPWHKPWADACISYTSRKGYKGINALLLTKPGEYITFAQAKKLGGKVKKGAKSSPVVLYKMCRVTDHNTGEEKTIPLPVRYYRVFHLDDVEGLPSKIKPGQASPIDQSTDKAQAISADYLSREKIKLNTIEQNRAYYTPSRDEITLPLESQFTTASEYYSTLFHEITHSTGHASRLKRDTMQAPAAFGSQDYGREELVAEMGAAMLTSAVGISNSAAITNSAAYIQSWLTAIQKDEKMIVWAANKAQRAADFVQGIAPESYAGDQGAES